MADERKLLPPIGYQATFRPGLKWQDQARQVLILEEKGPEEAPEVQCHGHYNKENICGACGAPANCPTPLESQPGGRRAAGLL